MIYLDNAATTRPIREGLEFATEYNVDNYFNPSALYNVSTKLSAKIASARESVLKMVGGNLSHELIITSGGSEADNMALFSFCKRGKLIISAGEHSAVYQTAMELKNRGIEVVLAPLNKDGSVKTEELLGLIDDKVKMVSIVHVNNETGAINDILSISKKIKEKNKSVIFHSDGVQAYGKIDFKISDNVDLYSISAHKIGGVKGVGGLIKRKNLHINPLIFGGGQEGGKRSGTENVFAIMNFKWVTEYVKENLLSNFEKVKGLKRVLLDNLKYDKLTVISNENASPYVVSLCFEGIKGEVLQHMLENDEIYVGTGSACSSKSKYSRVITECGYKIKQLEGIIRVSFNPYTTKEEVLESVEKINEYANKLYKVIENV